MNNNENFCKMCGSPLVGANLVYDVELDSFYCTRCFPYIRTCHNCATGNLCDFETNPSPIPKQVQVTRQVGGAIMSQTTVNPERIKITCANGCPCFSADFGCGKQFCMQNRFCPVEKWSEKIKYENY